MNKIQKIAFDRIVKSLRETPELWIYTAHEAKNADCTIWLSNRYYATRFQLGPIQCGENNPYWRLFPWEYWRPQLIREVERAYARVAFKDVSL